MPLVDWHVPRPVVHTTDLSNSDPNMDIIEWNKMEIRNRLKDLNSIRISKNPLPKLTLIIAPFELPRGGGYLTLYLGSFCIF